MHSFLLRVEESMWFALDLDRTLVDDRLVPFPCAVEILELLKARGYQMTVVSYNLDVELIIPRLGWQDYFRKVICDRNRTKAQVIKDIAIELGLKPGDAVLVDDLEDNVRNCLNTGIHAVQVNPMYGFQLMEVHALLHYFQLPVMWVAPIPPALRHNVQSACPNYFLRFYPMEMSIEELGLYARDNTAAAAALGMLRYQSDNYGSYYLLQLRDTRSNVSISCRSGSLPISRELSCVASRITLSDVIYQLFTMGVEELAFQVREQHFEQFIWSCDRALSDSSEASDLLTVEDIVPPQPSAPILIPAQE